MKRQSPVVNNEKNEDKRSSRLSVGLDIAGFIWTILSTLYTLGTAIFFVVDNWVATDFGVAIITLIVVWIVALIVIVAMSVSRKEVKTGTKAVKVYKKSVKIFKAFVNVLFVVVNAVSMAGVVKSGVEGIGEYITIGFTVLVAVVQLGLKIGTLIFKAVMKRKGKGKVVEVVTFVDGEPTENKLQSKVLQKIYHADDK